MEWILSAVIFAVLVVAVLMFVRIYSKQVKESGARIAGLEKNNFENEKAVAVAQAELESEKNKVSALKEEMQQSRNQYEEKLKQLSSEIKSEQERFINSEKELSTLKTSLDEREKNFSEQFRQLEDSRENLKKEFQLLASQVLEEKGKAFGEKNSEHIQSLLSPFKQQMTEFKERVESIHKDDLVQRSALTNELKNIKELNQQMTEEAQALTKALKGEKKTQGNWGELMLESVLERSGLTKNMIYHREKSVKDTEEGVAGRMDVVIKLPEGKHLVVDAKVSLNAYTRAINAESDAEQQLALKEHVQAMQKHIKDLSQRDYTAYSEINSPDIVFMFVPVESAFVEACKFDDQLVQTAWDRGILLVTPTTLLASLKIVSQLWRLENQNKSTAALADKARKVYDKLNVFLESMEKLGTQIDTVGKTYDRAVTQLTSGKGNLLKQANDFKELGVRVSKNLPEFFTDKGELELDPSPQISGDLNDSI